MLDRARQLTVLALTSKATSDGGRLTRQFLRGTRATSAVVVGFLGAMIRAQNVVVGSTRRESKRVGCSVADSPDSLSLSLHSPHPSAAQQVRPTEAK